MSRHLLAAALCVLVAGSGSVSAQQVSGGSGGPLVISITKADCSRLISHVPAPDVAYKPGVDVRGKPVVSADADPAAAAFAKRVLPEVLEIPININPLNYGQRNTANANKAAAATAVSNNTAAIAAAKTQATTLSNQLAALNSQKSTLAANYATATAANTASTGGSGANSILLAARAKRQAEIDSSYASDVASVNAKITSANSAITANNTTLTNLQSQDTSLRQTYTNTDMATQGTLAGISAKGLDATQTRVGTVKYDIARNTFTYNDQPMLSEDQQKLAEACAKQGVR